MIQSVYKTYDLDLLEDLQAQYIIDSWSYSKVMAFARNEKAFEMNYVYGIRSKSSSTTIAGKAYHKALEEYFNCRKEGSELDLAALEMVAFDFIERVGANDWKLQKTTPTVDDCKQKALKTVCALLHNFLSEKSIYLDNIKTILHVEVYCDEWLTINGVDIPLPCHGVIDLVVETYDGKILAIDHKSKTSFTDEKEAAMAIGSQAITYAKLLEAKIGIMPDGVLFIENKHSANKDKSSQLFPIPISLTEDAIRLYEALLYEPLRKMTQAASDPDYVYVINQSDNFVDMAELYDFWSRTMICEVEDFNVSEAKKDLVSKRLRKIRDASLSTITPSVIKQFRSKAASFIQYDLSNKDMKQDQIIKHTLQQHGIVVEVAHMFDGYSSNTYLLEFSAGVKITSIYKHRLDIANQLNVSNVRIASQLTVYEGKSYLAIDFSKKRERDLIFDKKERIGMKIPIGKDNFGNTIYWDLDNHSTPHALVCGATGSGKSVLIKSTIEYCKPVIQNIIIFDPKFEFMDYSGRALVLNEISDIEQKMIELIGFMNRLVREQRKEFTLVIFDEFADAVAQSKGKELEENLRILLQKGRSCGIRVMAATQRASVKVITGDAKVNFPVQICFRVPKEIDSKVVIDEAGAESLAGRGDGLIKSPEYDQVTRFQAFYKH